MRVMIVTPICTEPPETGSAARVRDMISIFESAGHDVSICISPFSRITYREQKLPEMLKTYSQVCVLNNGKPYKGSFFQRIILKIQVLIRKIDIWPVNTIKNTRIFNYMISDSYISNAMVSQFEGFVKTLRPEVIVFEYVFTRKLLNEKSGVDYVSVVDTHDVFSNRNIRLNKQGVNDFWFSLTQRQERNLLSSFDMVFAIQENEKSFYCKLLSRENKVETLDVISPPIFLNPSFPSAPAIGYIASPTPINVYGLKLYLEKQWPAVLAELPDAVLLVAGGISSKFFLNVNLKGVKFLGKVESLSSFYDECSAMINPCSAGSGLKIKCIESMSYGKSIVTTPLGAEGLEDAIGCGVFCFDLNDGGYAEACIKLLQNKSFCYEAGLKAARYIEYKYTANLEKLSNFKFLS